ncbi:MAG: hypothetical protein ACRCV0_03355 [Brevinema sp.]
MKKLLLALMALFTIVGCSTKGNEASGELPASVQAIQGLWGDQRNDFRFEGTSHKQDGIPYDPDCDAEGKYAGKDIEVSGFTLAVYNISGKGVLADQMVYTVRNKKLAAAWVNDNDPDNKFWELLPEAGDLPRK